MGHVTDGGLEPEPVASIKAAARQVNRILALIYGSFGRILGWRVPAGGCAAGIWPVGEGRRRDGTGNRGLARWLGR